MMTHNRTFRAWIQRPENGHSFRCSIQPNVAPGFTVAEIKYRFVPYRFWSEALASTKVAQLDSPMGRIGGVITLNLLDPV